MYDALKQILAIQELDIRMIRLMRVKKERSLELQNLKKIKEDLVAKHHEKEREILEVKHLGKLAEADVEEVKQKIKRLEAQQHQIKKVEEFNALSQEMAQTERDRVQKEQKASDLLDRLSQEEELLISLKETLDHTIENSKELESEIVEAIKKINEEGSVLKGERDELAKDADPEVLPIYERLINNKKDRVVVPIENRTCSGCHILVTAQDENLVRRGERLVYCEHCSRIQYWPETVAQVEVEGAKPTRRRRRTKAST